MSRAIIGCEPVEQVEECTELARSFTPLSAAQMAALETKVKPVAKQALFSRCPANLFTIDGTTKPEASLSEDVVLPGAIPASQSRRASGFLHDQLRTYAKEVTAHVDREIAERRARRQTAGLGRQIRLPAE
jgi:hypothetical protein